MVASPVPVAVNAAGVPLHATALVGETVTVGFALFKPVKSPKAITPGEVSTKPVFEPGKRAHGVVPAHSPMSILVWVPTTSPAT